MQTDASVLISGHRRFVDHNAGSTTAAPATETVGCWVLTHMVSQVRCALAIASSRSLGPPPGTALALPCSLERCANPVSTELTVEGLPSSPSPPPPPRLPSLGLGDAVSAGWLCGV